MFVILDLKVSMLNLYVRKFGYEMSSVNLLSVRQLPTRNGKI